jgi:predicted HicB family RNase H-like nuclease
LQERRQISKPWSSHLRVGESRSRGEEPERPFSGKLNVRLGSELHRAAALAAASEGESLNNWLVGVVKDAAENRPSRRPRYSPSPTKSRRSTKR